MQAAIRESLIGAVHTPYTSQYPLVPIVYDNEPFDRNSPPDAWVEYEIKFAGSAQVGMSASPLTRIHGFLYVTVWTRHGVGSKRGLLMLDWFAEQLKYKSVGDVCLQAAEPVSGTPPTGWYMEQLKFYFYTNPA